MYKVLIVDDIDTNRLLLKQMLSVIGGYTTVEAANGLEGIQRFQEESPDLVLMDVNMPVMDGYQSASAIKTISGAHYTPIIFITALSAEISLKNALTSGGDDFISKPFNSGVLESKMKAHLRIREMNEQINDNNLLLASHNQELVNEQELIEHFFENAISQSFLDEHIIKYHMSSLSTFNGDILFVQKGPEGGLYVIMGDFSGHGLTAAMGTLPVAMIFFRMVAESASIENIAREINKELVKYMPSRMFFAATLLELNTRGDIMSVWMGGVPESYCFGTDGDLKHIIHAQHMPLGILSDDEFDASSQILSVANGDKLYLYSDGVIEANNSEGEPFGDERLKDTLVMNKENRFDAVLKNLKLFTSKNEQKDDITLVELTCQALPAIQSNGDVIPGENLISTATLPWKLSISITEKEMRMFQPVKKVSDILGALPGLARHQGILHTILSEMFSNALDHSILALDSENKDNEEHFVDYYQKREELLLKLSNAFINFEFDFSNVPEQSCLQIRMTDNGQGFHGANLALSDELLHGRGLGIISSFCQKIRFSEDGNTMDVTYLL